MMMLKNKIVENIPNKMEKDILYISLKYKSVGHICPCGCGEEVFTPISKDGWKITYDGESISLYPSIGNWGLKCQSHYWIKNGSIKWDFSPRYPEKRESRIKTPLIWESKFFKTLTSFF